MRIRNKSYFNKVDTIFECTNLFNRCEAISRYLFDEEYLVHLYNISSKQICMKDKCAALLLGCLDTIDVEMLKYLEIPEEVIEIVQLLKKPDDVCEDVFTSLILRSGNLSAINIRYADLLERNFDKENSSIIRLTRFFDR